MATSFIVYLRWGVDDKTATILQFPAPPSMVGTLFPQRYFAKATHLFVEEPSMMDQRLLKMGSVVLEDVQFKSTGSSKLRFGRICIQFSGAYLQWLPDVTS